MRTTLKSWNRPRVLEHAEKNEEGKTEIKSSLKFS
jgi:hypothetical protein